MKNPKKGSSHDILKLLETDVVLDIFKRLDDPADLVRASAVSRDWQGFVVGSELSKQLSLNQFTQLSHLKNAIESSSSLASAKGNPWLRNHEVYARLLHVLQKLTSSTAQFECIQAAIIASSTDICGHIIHTLEPRETSEWGLCFWSSKGQKDPNGSETLIYKLNSDLCVITSIRIQPFQAFYQDGSPIYSAKSVRFRLGHIIYGKLSEAREEPLGNDYYAWRYDSPELDMAKEKEVQEFQFPDPVLCIGGFVRIELLGRAQRNPHDGLFYTCINYISVIGRSLSPAYRVKVEESTGKFHLECSPDMLPQTLALEKKQASK